MRRPGPRWTPDAQHPHRVGGRHQGSATSRRNPTGYFFGGHTVARQGFKTFQVQGVEFYQMGQGGRIGHYPVHFHHARKTHPRHVREGLLDQRLDDALDRAARHPRRHARAQRRLQVHRPRLLPRGRHRDQQHAPSPTSGSSRAAAVDNVQNPRKVPGILAAPDLNTNPGSRTSRTTPTTTIRPCSGS